MPDSQQGHVRRAPRCEDPDEVIYHGISARNPYVKAASRNHWKKNVCHSWRDFAVPSLLKWLRDDGRDVDHRQGSRVIEGCFGKAGRRRNP